MNPNRGGDQGHPLPGPQQGQAASAAPGVEPAQQGRHLRHHAEARADRLDREGAPSLGDEFILGSIAANQLLPGGRARSSHVDYPYWDIYKRSSFPTNINPSFPLNLQATILLDDFTAENGAHRDRAAHPEARPLSRRAGEAAA